MAMAEGEARQAASERNEGCCKRSNSGVYGAIVVCSYVKRLWRMFLIVVGLRIANKDPEMSAGLGKCWERVKRNGFCYLMEWSVGCSFGLDTDYTISNHLPLRVLLLK